MFFDFHLHPSFKPFLTDVNPGEKDHCWNTYGNLVGIIKSQSSLEQLKAGDFSVVVSPIYVMEKAMTSSFLLKYIVPKLSMLDKEILDTAPSVDYYQRFEEELAHFLKSENFDPSAGKSFNLIRKTGSFEEGELNILLAIEGGHALERTGVPLKDTLIEIKNSPFVFIYLTLTHMMQFPLCTHAFGMKMIKENDQFKPNGYGLTDLGREIIDTAYDESLGSRILIDAKHMSLVSRQQFYAYREVMGYQHIPIVASHMGLAGISWEADEVKKYVEEKKCVSDRGYIQVKYDRPEGIGSRDTGKTHFNPWSINLYNEEINIILDSGGLIGVSLDQRILGSQKVSGEFFDEDEWNDWMGDRIDKEIGQFDDEPLTPEEIKPPVETKEISIFNKRKHLRHLCNQILHLVLIGGPRAWKHICLGSDFDGLIDPINSCTSAAQYDKLEKDMAKCLEEMVLEVFQEDPNANLGQVVLKDVVRDILYNNAINFMEKHFSLKFEPKPIIT